MGGAEQGMLEEDEDEDEDSDFDPEARSAGGHSWGLCHCAAAAPVVVFPRGRGVCCLSTPVAAAAYAATQLPWG
jgi:hypothetical protein